MGYSADKSPLIGHLAGPIRRLKPLGAQRQEKCGPNHLTREGLHATTPRCDGVVILGSDRCLDAPPERPAGWAAALLGSRHRDRPDPAAPLPSPAAPGRRVPARVVRDDAPQRGSYPVASGATPSCATSRTSRLASTMPDRRSSHLLGRCSIDVGAPEIREHQAAPGQARAHRANESTGQVDQQWRRRALAAKRRLRCAGAADPRACASRIPNSLAASRIEATLRGCSGMPVILNGHLPTFRPPTTRYAATRR